MRLIDSHVHLYPALLQAEAAAWAATRGEAHWARLCLRRRATGVAVQTFPSVDELLRDMDAAGIERSVLLGWYWEHHDTCVWQNRFYASCVEAHPDRLSACATFYAGSSPEVVENELRRARDEGLCGLGELSPQSQGVSLEAPGLSAALELAATWSWPVNVHVTDPLSRPFPGRVETPLAEMETWVDRHPRTHFILAHWAGGLDVTARTNVWVDTAAAPLLYKQEAWTRFLSRARADQVLFGSDYPLVLYPTLEHTPGLDRWAAEFRSAVTDSPRRELIACQACQALFRLPI